MNCYCGSAKQFERCCQPIHGAHAAAETAEALMRARYSAYCLGDNEFIRRSWLTAYQQQPEAVSEAAKLKWCGLTIVSTQAGQKEQCEGQVEFKAWFIEENRLYCLHENSRFVHQRGLWFYQDGEIFEQGSKAISSNTLCPCGSGKKFKRCCRS
ncbi:MAG: YchJ family metal-binding protein [Gammaproteobacteria bacterium]|nr:YchJ family metal-binding protein [Gammaproteobacteria bacterium]